jgi:hypothetical protein
LELTQVLITHFFSQNSCLFLRVLSNPVKNLLFPARIQDALLPSMSRQLQALAECGLHITTWAIEHLAMALIESGIWYCDSGLSRID